MDMVVAERRRSFHDMELLLKFAMTHNRDNATCQVEILITFQELEIVGEATLQPPTLSGFVHNSGHGYDANIFAQISPNSNCTTADAPRWTNTMDYLMDSALRTNT